MSGYYRRGNTNRHKHFLAVGQSFITQMRVTSGGGAIMNYLHAGGYFGGMVGRRVTAGIDGIATLKKYGDINGRPSLWNEYTDLPGGILIGIDGDPIYAPSSSYTVTGALDPQYGRITQMQRDTITDILAMQGQGDEAWGLLPSEGPVWRSSHGKWINWIRSFLRPADPHSIKVVIDQMSRRPNREVYDPAAQTIREQKLLLAAELTNVIVGFELYDLSLLHDTDPDEFDNVHMDEQGMIDMARRASLAILGGANYKTGPVMSGASIGASDRIDMPITVEAGETLYKPGVPCGIRIEINGVKTIPVDWSWSGNTLRAHMGSAIDGGGVTRKVFPIYGEMSDYTYATGIRYVAPTSTSHPMYGRRPLPLRTGLPISF